jgi:site-specific DNA-methyltransferase (adenine-specific)
MKRYPDNYFDLAIVDPPYTNDYKVMDGLNQDMKGKKAKVGKYHYSSLADAKPTLEYWNELFRVSKNQIVWGGNYFTNHLPESRCWVVWDKDTQESNFADVEMAWTSFDKNAKLYRWRWNGMLQQDMKNKEERIHPTQKPVGIYAKVVSDFCKEGAKIIDTYIGSGSIAIAVDNANKIDKMNLTLVGCELDKDYYNATMKRIKEQTSWQSLF